MSSRLHFAGHFARRMKLLALAAGLLISLSMPATYFIMGWAAFEQQAEDRAKTIAHRARLTIIDNPALWHYNLAKFIEADEYARPGLNSIRIYDRDARLRAELTVDRGAAPSRPFRFPIAFNNEAYGYIEIAESIRPLLLNTLGLTVFFSLLGLSSGLLLYRYPLAIVKKAEQGVQIHAEQAKQQADSEVARLDRLRLVGQMAASIGHEVRNPLTTVRGYLQFFAGKCEFTPLASQFQLMIDELDRANGIITEFLSLAHNRALQMKECDLGRLISSLLPLIGSDAIIRGIAVEADLTPGPATVFADEKEIRQLILNLARNGLEAMAAGGRLTIGTAAAEGGVLLFVADQGPGIDPAILPKLGTPFLTTKETGTGLGLAICYTIAHRHGAAIAFATGPAGTTCTVRFPAVPPAPAEGDRPDV